MAPRRVDAGFILVSIAMPSRIVSSAPPLSARPRGARRRLVNLSWVLALVTVAGCESRDMCVDAHRLVIDSPRGGRQLAIDAAQCDGAAPQVSVVFPQERLTRGVFAASDTALRLEGRWISEDTAEITYPARAHVVRRETHARLRNEQVVVRYVARAEP